MLGPCIALRFLRLFQWCFTIGVLIINSVFLGKLNAFDLPVDRSIVLVEGFAITAFVWNLLGFPLRFRTGRSWCSWVVVPMELFVASTFIFIATVSKTGVGNCNNYRTSFGGPAKAGMPSVGQWCGMQEAALGLSIAAM